LLLFEINFSSFLDGYFVVWLFVWTKSKELFINHCHQKRASSFSQTVKSSTTISKDNLHSPQIFFCRFDFRMKGLSKLVLFSIFRYSYFFQVLSRKLLAMDFCKKIIRKKFFNIFSFFSQRTTRNLKNVIFSLFHPQMGFLAFLQF